MEKDKILENKGKDFYAIQAEVNSCKIAAVVMVLLAFVYYTYELLTGKGSNPEFYSLITIFNAVMFGYRAVMIKEKRVLSIFACSVWTILTALLILSYLGVL